MLDWYRNDDRIQMISGTNYLADQHKTENGFFFSRFYAIWGWATWRRALWRWRLATLALVIVLVGFTLVRESGVDPSGQRQPKAPDTAEFK